MENIFTHKRAISKTAMNILQKRYFQQGENKWDDIVNRVIEHVIPNAPEEQKETTRQMMLEGYFIPNSPCLVNSGKPGAGLAACFVVDFPDNIEGIYKTKLDFALIARKGGGCGTSLTKIRPEGAPVAGSTHGYAGGGIKFANTISHDANAMTQSGFRAMAIMFTESVYHPDIIKFIEAKHEEGKIANANISVVVDDAFMRAVETDGKYWTEFGGKKYLEYSAKAVFDLIVEGMWKNGEPGILFKNRIDDSPYKYTGQEIFATNPCSEQPLPSNGMCNLGSLDISKFFDKGKGIDWKKFDTAVRYGTRFLDSVIDVTGFPTKDIEIWSLENRAIGLGIMGYADLCLMAEIAYGSPEALNLLEQVLYFVKEIANSESIRLGQELGIPKMCQSLPAPRRNITLTTIAPTGTISLIAGCVIGDTEVHTISGKQKIKNLVGTEPLVYCSGEKEIFVKKAHDVRKTREKAEVWKIKFDTDDELILTPDHKVMLSDGTWKETKDLRFGDSVRAFHKSIWSNKAGISSTALYMTNLPRKHNHRAIAECFFGKKIKPNEVVHHIDFNHINDSPDNLAIIPSYEHRKIHSINIVNWSKTNKGKSYEDIYGKEKSLNIINKKSSAMLGEKNHRFGKKLTDKEKEIISEKTKEAMMRPDIRERYLQGMEARKNHKVVSVEFYGYEDVYNMEVDDVENYIANGVVVHNCSSGIEPVFSEITIRNDKTGTYTFENDLADKPYFRCAVSSNGAAEVTWEEHINTLAAAQRHIDSGVSKTINFPTMTHRETIGKAVIKAWKDNCKGLAVYRNGSRAVEVLSPKNLQKDKCPLCGNELIEVDNKKRCAVCNKDTIIEKALATYD